MKFEDYSKDEVIELLASLYSKEEYQVLFDEATINQRFFNLLWEIIKERKESESWRVLWILDHATEKENHNIFPILQELYELVLNTKNESFIRHAMKLILRCPINEDYAGELLDKCIKWMNDPKAKISSQALGLEFFYRVCLLYPDMIPELSAHIYAIMERSPSAGYRMRLKEILEKLDTM